MRYNTFIVSSFVSSFNSAVVDVTDAPGASGTGTGATDSGAASIFDADGVPLRRGSYVGLADGASRKARGDAARKQAALDAGLDILEGMDEARILAAADAVGDVAAFLATLENRNAWMALLAARSIFFEEDGDAARSAARVADSDAGSVVSATARLSQFNRAASTMLGSLNYKPAKDAQPHAKASDAAIRARASAAVAKLAGKSSRIAIV